LRSVSWQPFVFGLEGACRRSYFPYLLDTGRLMAETIGKYSNLVQGIHLQPHLDKPLGVLMQVVLEREDLARRRRILATLS
jgi:hypothetical protein